MPIFSFITNTVLPFLGKLGKGKATVAGTVTALTAKAVMLVAPHVITDQNIVQIILATAEVIKALGELVAAFGIGRKATVATLGQ
jgi:predicted ATPase